MNVAFRARISVKKLYPLHQLCNTGLTKPVVSGCSAEANEEFITRFVECPVVEMFSLAA